jgi:hypothetical protein
VFDWQAAFPQVFKIPPNPPLSKGGNPQPPLQKGVERSGGGFDAVIGNPPYIRIQTMKEWAPLEVEHYKRAYHAASKGNYDIYVVFVERGLYLLNKKGKLGFIVPNKFFRTDYGEGLRRVLSDSSAVSTIVDFGHNQVFAATTYTCLLFLESGKKTGDFEYTNCDASADILSQIHFEKRAHNALTADAWTFENTKAASLIAKLWKRSVRLLDLPADMSRGSSTGGDEVFVFENKSLNIEKGILREPVFASDFGRYKFVPPGKWRVIFPYVSENGGFRLYTEEELKRLFPRAYEYLHQNQAALKRRKQFKEWYGFSAPRNLDLHDHAHIAIPLLANRGLFALITNQSPGKLCPMASGGFTITISRECSLKPEYVLGLLNSKLMFWRLRGVSNLFRGGWITCTKQYFGKLPIRNINYADAADREHHDKIVKLVGSMLKLNTELATAKTPQDTTLLQRQIDATDRQIDQLVYALYGLSDEEIALVEGEG